MCCKNGCFLCYNRFPMYMFIKGQKENPFSGTLCFYKVSNEWSKGRICHTKFKRITGGQVTAKIMTTIISKARSVKPTIKWWLWRNEKRIFCTKIINELNRKIAYTLMSNMKKMMNIEKENVFFVYVIGFLYSCNLQMCKIMWLIL